jgi:CMP-N-acetylneuraminic acid synthetase
MFCQTTIICVIDCFDIYRDSQEIITCLRLTSQLASSSSHDLHKQMEIFFEKSNEKLIGTVKVIFRRKAEKKTRAAGKVFQL